MAGKKRDKTKVEPATGAEEPEAPEVYRRAAAKGTRVNATSAEIPGTGKIVKTKDGKESKRVVNT